MAGEFRDMTFNLDRLTAFEDRLGVRLEALFASVEGPDSDGDYYMTVRGELHSDRGMDIDENLQIVVSAFDEDGRIIGNSTDFVYAEDFFGFHSFEMSTYVKGIEPARLRIHPTKM